MSYDPAGDSAQLREELVSYLDGELDAEQSRRIEERAAAEPDARRMLEELDRTWHMLDALDAPATSEDFTRTTLEMVALAAAEDVQKAQAEAPRRHLRARLRAAAGLVGAAAAGFLIVAGLIFQSEHTALPRGNAATTFHVATSLVPDPNAQLLQDLPILENLDQYRETNGVDFLHALNDGKLFAEDVLPAASAGAVETFAQRRRQVEEMSAEQRDDLFRSEQQFHALPAAEQQRIRDLYEQIEYDPDRDKLRATMNRYCKWFETQPPFRRRTLLDKKKTLAERIATVKDFLALTREAGKLGLEIALDLAFQCSPDHPYLKEHPEWFLWRPDGTVQYAENPPKLYQDIIPFNFETASWRELWEELKGVVFFWMDQGVRIFRVDNPHTKPFPFWEWLIGEAKRRSPEVIFLAEAFTRPKVMYRLAKLGFGQSYSYFAWRTSKEELTGYLEELTRGEVSQYLRPNFWPNTPDILTQYLQVGGRPAFVIRLVLAATLSSSYGIYGPPFELCIGAAEPASEEYLHAEKYEIHSWDREALGHLKGLIATLNWVRRENPALQETNNLQFYQTDSDSVIFYGKSTGDGSNTVLVAVNLDPFHAREARLQLPLARLGIEPGQSYLVQDLLSGENSIWQGEWNQVRLDPGKAPALVFRVRSWLRREADFDYYL